MSAIDVDAATAKLLQAASQIVGFEVTAETYRRITPEQASAVLKHLSSDADFRELALQRGNPISEGNIWLGARANGSDIPIEEVTRMSNGQGPSAEYQAAMAAAMTEGDAAPPQSSRTPLAADAAKARLAELSANPEWAAKALTRGTAEARESIALNADASGNQLSDAQIGRLAAGFAAEPVGPN